MPHACGAGRGVNLFQKGKLIAMYEAKITLRKHKAWTVEQWKEGLMSRDLLCSRVIDASG